MRRRRRLLTVGHSYVVAQNRRLAHELARAGASDWEVTAAAPRFFHGDLREIDLEPRPLERSSLAVLPAHFTRSPHLFAYGKALAELLEQPWDVVHCWEEPYVLAGAQVAAWAARGTPLVYTTAQNLQKSYPPPFNWMERFSLARARGWMAVGHTAAATLSARDGYRDKPWRVVPLGVDVDRFHPDEACGRSTRRELGFAPAGPPIVGYLGRFVPEKGVHVLMRVLDGIGAPWRALFVGGGPLEKALRRWASAHGEDRARVVTGVPHDDVPRHLCAMDVLCAPSQTTSRWREQLGRMLIEGFACGVPVIASDSGEIPHVVADAGVVVGERDVTGWQRAIGALLESPEARRDLAARGRSRAESAYSWPTVAKQTLDFLEDGLDARRRAP